jgi:hypothetical protein
VAARAVMQARQRALGGCMVEDTRSPLLRIRAAAAGTGGPPLNHDGALVKGGPGRRQPITAGTRALAPRSPPRRGLGHSSIQLR